MTSHFIGHHKNKITAQLGGLYVNVDKSGGLLKLKQVVNLTDHLPFRTALKYILPNSTVAVVL